MTAAGTGLRGAGVALALAGLVGTAVGLQVVRDRVYGEPRPERGFLYLQSPQTVRRLSLSYAALLADLYWVRAVQYYGGNRLAKEPNRNYDLLYPLLDITTTLDPAFNIAYRFGAVFLAAPFPGGAGRPDLAIALLEKGFRANPRRWHYLYDIGFVHYWELSDFPGAARWFEKAADVPGAPWWLRSMAAVTATQGGDRRASRLLWQVQLDNAENDWVRNNAALRLRQLDALDQIDALTEALRQYTARSGAGPRRWEDLVRAGVIPGMPRDPTGVPYIIDPDSGVVTVSPESDLYPLPVGPRATPRAR
ncbi:MAG: hypothetical protein EHM24_04125 [Acidobacteria bacterium]|nr:MAG: hypothetical protein EHM24_04125 [Acidobacteriota bacterium]